MRVEVALTLTTTHKRVLAAIFAAGTNGVQYQSDPGDWVTVGFLRQLELVRCDEMYRHVVLTVPGLNIARRVVAEAAKEKSHA